MSRPQFPVIRRDLAPRPIALLAFLFAGCLGEAPPDSPGGKVQLSVAPLNLSGVTNAVWTVTVTNGPNRTGGLVWSRQLSSDTYGDGEGSLSYVGPCDASTGQNTVTLTLDALYDEVGLIPGETYANPTPVSRSVLCQPNADAAVVFDLTLVRQADQGFFDVAVQFDDIFCSAKLDCQRPDASDLELLHTPEGERDMTVVLGFACTGSLTGSTWLYMDDLVITCSGSEANVRVTPVGLGSITPTANPSGYLFGAAVYRGVEGYAGKAYWNVALGLDDTRFATMGDCTLRTRATASELPFPQVALGFPLPEGTIYPVIDWSVQLSSATGRTCTSHEVNGGTGVATDYLGYLPLTNAFTWSDGPIHLQHRYDPATGIVVSAGAPICNPTCARGTCVSDTPTNTCDCTGTGYGGPTCATPVCANACLNGGTCSAPDTCTCPFGFDGPTCADDIDECATDHGGCGDPLYTTCSDNPGAPPTCNDIDECLTNHGGCGDPAYTTCSDNPNGPPTCSDIDECATDHGGCGDPAYTTCTNNPDGPPTCSDIDECQTNHGGCGDPLYTTCENNLDAPPTCGDIDECLTNNGGCGPAQFITCANNSGAAPTCSDIDECLTNNGGCGAAAAWTCTNNLGAAPTCTDRDECALGTHDCGAGATCTNTTGGFTCECGPGGVDNSGGAGTACTYRANCLALHLAAPSLVDGVYVIDPDGAGGDAPFAAYCDMTTEGGGWTLIYTSSDDGVATFTWDARTLLSTQTTVVGVPTQSHRDFKSPALHRLPFTSLLFNHEPSGVWAMYGVRTAATSFGAFVAGLSVPMCPTTASSGYKMLAGSLVANPGVVAPASKLCETDLYFNLGDHDGGLNPASCNDLDIAWNNATFGPVWNSGFNGDCNFDDPAYAATGPAYPCSGCEAGTGALETTALGFGELLGLNSAPAGSAGNYLQVFVRDYPLASCLAWRRAGATTSGTYTIDPDGPEGALAPFEVTCDMVTEGGGWTTIPYTANLAYQQQFSGGDLARWLPSNFTLGLSTAQIDAIRAVSTEGRQTYVGLCDGVIHYFYNGDSNYLYAIGFRFQTGVETPSFVASYSPHNITVTQDGCKTNGGEGGTLANATIFDIRSVLVPVINVRTNDNGDTGERFGSPLTTNPAYLR